MEAGYAAIQREKEKYDNYKELSSIKGQLISKCPLVSSFGQKFQQNYFWISALSFFVASWGLSM